ncbi:GNAT family N-acetyltransferase [Deinococcus ficus]|uniref:GNAT family N-acetyltransferase n=1 Tax=Deinococcus ficus TaxID=317577 RepID=UPI0003B50B3B
MNAAGHAAPFVIRDVTDPWRMRDLEELQATCFGYADRELLPGTLLRISAVTGGVLLGAYPAGDPDGKPVGHAFGFPALQDGRTWHHSHQLVVLPEWRGTGLAVALKLAQRERVLAQGLRRMTWTFDPLVARNARLNLGKLGARAVAYLPEFYALGGSRETAFPSDRLMVEWDLSVPPPARPAPAPQGVRVLEARPDGLPGPVQEGGEGPALLAEVPTRVDVLPGEARLAWRLALREALVGALGRGYAVTDLAREGERAFYVLTPVV